MFIAHQNPGLSEEILRYLLDFGGNFSYNMVIIMLTIIKFNTGIRLTARLNYSAVIIRAMNNY